MGAGKSTIGRKVARYLHKPFIDTDTFIETKYETSINDIIETSSLENFRTVEKKALKEITSFENYIISTGGGMPCYNANINTINNNGISIYFQYTPIELFKRLRMAKKERPLLKSMKTDELFEYVQNKLAERELYYKQAHFILNGKRLKIDYITSFISKILR